MTRSDCLSGKVFLISMTQIKFDVKEKVDPSLQAEHNPDLSCSCYT